MYSGAYGLQLLLIRLNLINSVFVFFQSWPVGALSSCKIIIQEILHVVYKPNFCPCYWKDFFLQSHMVRKQKDVFLD